MLRPAIYTIGHGGRSIESFIELLKKHQIDFLIDVRSAPYSRYQPEFSMRMLETHLEANGIRYVFMGDQLGGRPKDSDCYIDNKVDYDRVRLKSYYLAGIDRLEKAAGKDLGVVLLCSEQKPENCHRSKLIGRTLADRGIEVVHIDGNDDLTTQGDVMLRITGGQPSLFGDSFLHFKSKKRYRDESETDSDTNNPGNTS